MCKLGVHVSIHKSGQRGLFGEEGGAGECVYEEGNREKAKRWEGVKNSPLV